MSLPTYNCWLYLPVKIGIYLKYKNNRKKTCNLELHKYTLYLYTLATVYLITLKSPRDNLLSMDLSLLPNK